MGEQNTFDEICVKCVKVIASEQLQTVGKNVRKIRLKHKLTQADVAYFVFGDKSTISALERNKLKNITLLTLIKIADVLKVKLMDLFQEEN